MGARTQERKTQGCCSYEAFVVKDGRGDGNEINKYAGVGLGSYTFCEERS